VTEHRRASLALHTGIACGIVALFVTGCVDDIRPVWRAFTVTASVGLGIWAGWTA
jgi:hypothetical protein